MARRLLVICPAALGGPHFVTLASSSLCLDLVSGELIISATAPTHWRPPLRVAIVGGLFIIHHPNTQSDFFCVAAPCAHKKLVKALTNMS